MALIELSGIERRFLLGDTTVHALARSHGAALMCAGTHPFAEWHLGVAAHVANGEDPVDGVYHGHLGVAAEVLAGGHAGLKRRDVVAVQLAEDRLVGGRSGGEVGDLVAGDGVEQGRGAARDEDGGIERSDFRQG